MKKIILGTIAAAFTLALAACSQNVQGGYNFTDGSLDVNNSTLTITLDANQTTGFEWVLDVQGEGLEMKGSEYTENEGSEDAVGAPGVTTFTFEGKAAGTQTLTFTYERPFEESDPEKTVVVTVETNDKGAVVAAETVGSDGSVGSFNA